MTLNEKAGDSNDCSDDHHGDHHGNEHPGSSPSGLSSSGVGKGGGGGDSSSGEIYSDDEEAAYFPNKVKSRHRSRDRSPSHSSSTDALKPRTDRSRSPISRQSRCRSVSSERGEGRSRFDRKRSRSPRWSRHRSSDEDEKDSNKNNDDYRHSRNRRRLSNKDRDNYESPRGQYGSPSGTRYGSDSRKDAGRGGNDSDSDSYHYGGSSHSNVGNKGGRGRRFGGYGQTRNYQQRGTGKRFGRGLGKGGGNYGGYSGRLYHNVGSSVEQRNTIVSAEEIINRLQKGLSLLPPPKERQSDNLDQFNYPAPPSWYHEEVEKWEAREKEKNELEEQVTEPAEGVEENKSGEALAETKGKPEGVEVRTGGEKEASKEEEEEEVDKKKQRQGNDMSSEVEEQQRGGQGEKSTTESPKVVALVPPSAALGPGLLVDARTDDLVQKPPLVGPVPFPPIIPIPPSSALLPLPSPRMAAGSFGQMGTSKNPGLLINPFTAPILQFNSTPASLLSIVTTAMSLNSAPVMNVTSSAPSDTRRTQTIPDSLEPPKSSTGPVQPTLLPDEFTAVSPCAATEIPPAAPSDNSLHAEKAGDQTECKVTVSPSLHEDSNTSMDTEEKKVVHTESSSTNVQDVTPCGRGDNESATASSQVNGETGEVSEASVLSMPSGASMPRQVSTSGDDRLKVNPQEQRIPFSEISRIQVYIAPVSAPAATPPLTPPRNHASAEPVQTLQVAAVVTPISSSVFEDSTSSAMDISPAAVSSPPPSAEVSSVSGRTDEVSGKNEEEKKMSLGANDEDEDDVFNYALRPRQAGMKRKKDATKPPAFRPKLLSESDDDINYDDYLDQLVDEEEDDEEPLGKGSENLPPSAMAARLTLIAKKGAARKSSPAADEGERGKEDLPSVEEAALPDGEGVTGTDAALGDDDVTVDGAIAAGKRK